jgi:acyl-coenzyme A synthetase/AMP-(fatty) acid ligase
VRSMDLNDSANPLALLKGWAEARPQDTAIVGPRLSISWATLLNQVHALADYISGRNVATGSGVLIDAGPELERIYTLAAMQAGLFSAGLPAQHDSETLLTAGFRYLLTANPGTTIDGLDRILVPATLGVGHELVSEFIPRELEDHQLVRVVFSSGTSGNPKAIPFTLERQHARVVAADTHYMRQSPFLTTLSLRTVSGNTSFFLDLYRGATHLVAGDASFNWRLIKRHKVRGTMGSPSSLEMLVRAAEASPAETQLEVAESAGGFLNQGLVRRAAQALGCEIVNIYGSTEAGLVCWSYALNQEQFLAGQLFPGVEVKIYGPEGNLLPVGKEGEVGILTPYQAGEYLGDPLETKSRYKSGQFFPGDIGYLDSSGRLFIAGRSDDVINLHGQKINPHPIEAYAIETFGLREAVCILAANQMGRSFHIMLVVSENQVNADQMKMELFRRFSTKAPQAIFQRESIPKNEMGKVPRKALIQSATQVFDN